MEKPHTIVLLLVTLGLLIVLALGAVRWLTSPRTERVMPHPVPPKNTSELWEGLAQVAVPSGCPVSIWANGQVGWNSNETSIELQQLEVANLSRAKLLAFEIDWDIYLNGSESCSSQLAVHYGRKPFSCIAAGGSKKFDVKFSHSSTTGFKTISGKLTYADFADGTTCGKEQKTHIQTSRDNCREGFTSAYSFF